MNSPLDRFLPVSSIAYFTMEIALRPEMHTYSGGLGVLAGDTARSAADLNLPEVFVTLVSRQGYLRQEIDASGRQVDQPAPWNPEDWCEPLNAMVAVTIEGRRVWIRPWLYRCTSPLGHVVPVILLDTDIDSNDPMDRPITDRLYGGDSRYRLKQEAVLGIGGTRMLQALGFSIKVFHMNEGHAAFLTLELLRRYPRRSNRREAAGRAYDASPVLSRCLFTTHTPVEAGHDRFPYPLVQEVVGDLIELEELRTYAGVDDCNMTRLALNLSGYVNGVAVRHAETTQQMFPGYRVSAITNGVHAARWAYPSIARLFDKQIPHWAHEPELLFHADHLPDADIARAKREAKEHLVRLTEEMTGVKLDPELPILGFARRMTGYKRPGLILSDPDRLKAIAHKYPFQVVWAGKSHPADQAGKAVVESINQATKSLSRDIPMVYLQNYDMRIAEVLVAGADVWMNTPKPPLEASGTSGMKAALNGTLNLSTLDGWWVEAWIEDVTGWSIGSDGFAETEADHANSLYEKLEHKVLPLFANDKAQWTWMTKQSISKIAAYFNTQRMMRRYTSEAYQR
jgi:starch phosphorylase